MTSNILATHFEKVKDMVLKLKTSKIGPSKPRRSGLRV